MESHPKKKDIKLVISGMKNKKAQSLTGLTTDMIKSPPPKGCHLLSNLIRGFCLVNKEMDFESWHATKLLNLFKGKGDQQDPNNWWGNYLKETAAKIVSIIITKRFLSRLKKLESHTNSDTLDVRKHSLRSVHMIWRQHGLKSYAQVVNLVKSFESI